MIGKFCFVFFGSMIAGTVIALCLSFAFRWPSPPASPCSTTQLLRLSRGSWFSELACAPPAHAPPGTL